MCGIYTLARTSLSLGTDVLRGLLRLLCVTDWLLGSYNTVLDHDNLWRFALELYFSTELDRVKVLKNGNSDDQFACSALAHTMYVTLCKTFQQQMRVYYTRILSVQRLLRSTVYNRV